MSNHPKNGRVLRMQDLNEEADFSPSVERINKKRTGNQALRQKSARKRKKK